MLEVKLLYNELEQNQLLLNKLEILEDLDVETQSAINELKCIIPGIKHCIKVLELIDNQKTIKDVSIR